MSAGTALLSGGLLTVGMMQAYGQYEQGQMQAKVMEQNRIASELQAQDALERGAREEAKHRTQVRLFEGEQRAAMAAGGGELGAGSNVSLLEQTQQLGEMDALTIRSNAAREAWGYRTQANITGYQAELVSRKGRYDALGTMLTSGLQAFGTYRKG